jgi:hypothetical protein
MLTKLPHLPWLIIADNLGIYDTCFLRNVNKSIKQKVDDTILQIYLKKQGKKNTKLSFNNLSNSNITFPKFNLSSSFLKRNRHYYEIKRLNQICQFYDIKKIIDTNNLFSNYFHKVKINVLDVRKLIKAVKLVDLGLSEHYTVLCMELPHYKIDYAIALKSTNICDLFCYRGASEFSKTQVDNLINLKKYMPQDCFAFLGAERLIGNDIKKVIQHKIDGKLDYDALELAGCKNIFSKKYS